MEETVNTGNIYKITNIENNKIYIGQAKSFIQNHGKIIRHGFEGRFKIHIESAIKGSDSCPKLYNTIRKYGKEKFKIELLEICQTKDMDDIETRYILQYNSHINGYNILVTSKGKIFDNGTRIDKIKKSMKEKWNCCTEYKNKTIKANLEAIKKRVNNNVKRKLPHNIYKTDKGYDIRIMRNGQYKITSVNTNELTDEDKLKKAIQVRDQLINKMEITNDVEWHQKKLDHNGNPLPKYITSHIARGSSGYKIVIRKNGKRIDRIFVNNKYTMDEKLQLAIEKVPKILNKMDNSQANE